MEALILKRKILTLIGLFYLVDARSACCLSTFFIIYVSQLVAISFVQLMDWNIIKLSEECSSLLDFLILISSREVNILTFEWHWLRGVS